MSWREDMKKLLRPICWFHTVRLTLKLRWLAGHPLIPYVDGHLYRQLPTYIRRGRRYEPMKCIRCDSVDGTGWINAVKARLE